MALVTVDEVQAWLERSKLTLAPDDTLPEEQTASEVVLSRLSTKFDVTKWTSTASTPKLVRKIIAMLVAAWRYNTVYSETGDSGNPYADKLEARAELLLQQILDGALVLQDVTNDGPAVKGTLSFYPTDASTAINDKNDKGRVFTMGQVF